MIKRRNIQVEVSFKGQGKSKKLPVDFIFLIVCDFFHFQVGKVQSATDLVTATCMVIIAAKIAPVRTAYAILRQVRFIQNLHPHLQERFKRLLSEVYKNLFVEKF